MERNRRASHGGAHPKNQHRKARHAAYKERMRTLVMDAKDAKESGNEKETGN